MSCFCWKTPLLDRRGNPDLSGWGGRNERCNQPPRPDESALPLLSRRGVSNQHSTFHLKSILALTGPTAVGKTSLGIELAERADSEIVSVDSRQIYRELNIGTAKPSADELQRVPHHLIGERSLHEPVSAGQYALLAEDRIAEIISRNKKVILVGGSTLYLQALQHGLADIPEIDPDIRSKLVDRLRAEGSDALFRELESVDPEAAGTMDASKSQRIVRALEVYHGTGRPLSYYHQNPRQPRYRYETIVLEMDRVRLYERIERRVDIMLEEGLVDEVQGLLEAGFDPSIPVLRTIGYSEVIQYLQTQIDYTEMVRLIKRNTRRYAKRQMTWFRRFEEYKWMRREEVLGFLVSSFWFLVV